MNLLKTEMAEHHIYEHIYFILLQSSDIMKRCFFYIAGLKSKYKIYNILKNEQMIKMFLL
jgi:hypothetical protein